MSSLTAIVLAAGQGTRMKSVRAKVLHELCGRPMIDFPVRAALDAGARDVVVVVGRDRSAVSAHLDATFGARVRTAVQAEQRGTGDAVRAALPALPEDAHAALILYADAPLVPAALLAALVALRAEGDRRLALLTCTHADPSGYGRILRAADGAVRGVREERDASVEERAIHECNPGMYCARVDFLRQAIAALRPDNAQGELYLTDIVGAAAGDAGALVADAASLVGVNDRAQLAAVEHELYQRIADGWRRAGVTVRASARIDAGVVLEPDATVEHAVVLRGTTRVARGARIDVGSVLDDTEVGENAWLKPYSVCTRARIDVGAQIGPFAHLRPESDIGPEAHVGNFVEIKKTRLGRGAKANHLAYLGDGEVGDGANVGAGTIFCNYDGFAKHRTIIGAGAFIGSDSQLVAPVTIGAGAYVGTGTTVTKDVPPDALAIARTPQENKLGYGPRLRARLKARAAATKETPAPAEPSDARAGAESAAPTLPPKSPVASDKG